MGDVDRKRLHEDSGYPSKRPLQELSAKGPLTQADVVLFKKEAIWRQMKQYKAQAAELDAKALGYERRLLALRAVHQLLEAWYGSVAALAGAEKPRPLDWAANSAAIGEILEERKAFLAELLGKIAATADATAVEAVASLKKCMDLEAELQQAVSRRNELQERVAFVEERLALLQKSVERSESDSLKRVLLNSRAEEEEPKAQEEVKVENSVNEDNSMQEQELQSLRIEYDTLTAGHRAMTSVLAEKETALASARAQNQELSERMADLQESDLMKSKFYLSFLEKHKALLDKAAHATKANELTIKKLEELEAREGNVATLLSKEIIDENTRLKEHLSKAENDLVRVRTARDELIGKHTILKLEVDSRKDNAELLKMNEILHERLKRYENEKLEAASVDQALELLEKGELIKRFVVLNSELKDIEKVFQETRSLSIGKERGHLESEGIIKKLTIEKNKADQKYFASMRLKDSLVSENKVLKSQVAKSQELVTKSAELEKAYLNKIELLNKSVDDYKAIKQSSILEATSLHQTINQLTKSREVVLNELKTLKKLHTELQADAEANADKLAQLKVAHSRLEAKLRSTESLLSKYKQNNTSLILQEDEKQLEALRSITKCSVCLKNWKNMAITACGHVFCDSCVQERLNARLRRCPTCNKGFSANDLLQIHL